MSHGRNSVVRARHKMAAGFVACLAWMLAVLPGVLAANPAGELPELPPLAIGDAAPRSDPWDALFENDGLASLPATPLTTRHRPDLGGEPPESVAPSWATTSDDLLQLTADYVEFDRKAGRVVVKGKAYAELGAMKLWAEGMEVELKPGRVYATGDVHFLRATEDIRGRTLDYSYKLREGEMSQAETWRGPNKVVAARMEISPRKIIGHDLYTTACDHDPPHYRVSAQKGTLIPNHSLVLERAAVRVGNRRILSLKRYKVSLKPGQSSNFYLRPGYSTSRGFTVESGYDFFFSDHEFGRVVLNSSSRAGGLGGLAFRYGHGKPSGGDLTVVRNVSRLTGADPSNTSAFLDLTSDSYSWAHRQQLSERGNLVTNVNLTRADVGQFGINEELLFSGTINQRIPDYTLGLQVARRIDLDGSGYALDDLIPVLNQSPSFTIQKDEPIDLGGEFRLGLRGAFQVISERLSGETQIQESTKTGMNLNLTGPAIRIGDTRLAWSLEERLDWYSSASDRNYFSLNVNGSRSLGNGFELGTNYVLQRANGVSPFRTFDVLQDQNLGSLFFRQRLGERFHATWLQITEDLDRGEFRSAATNLFWHSPSGSRTRWSHGLNFGYGFQGEQKLSDIELRTISTNSRVARGNWRHQLITNYDTVQDRLGSFSTGSDVRINKNLRLQVASNYGRGGTGKLDRTRLTVGLTRDLHAWEARLRWDIEQKEAMLEFYLKHSPKKAVAIRADYDAGLGLRPQYGEKLSRPGPILADIPRP